MVLGCGQGDGRLPSFAGAGVQRSAWLTHKSAQTLSSHSVTQRTAEVTAVTQNRPASRLRLV